MVIEDADEYFINRELLTLMQVDDLVFEFANRQFVKIEKAWVFVYIFFLSVSNGNKRPNKRSKKC